MGKKPLKCLQIKWIINFSLRNVVISGRLAFWKEFSYPDCKSNRMQSAVAKRSKDKPPRSGNAYSVPLQRFAVPSKQRRSPVRWRKPIPKRGSDALCKLAEKAVHCSGNFSDKGGVQEQSDIGKYSNHTRNTSILKIRLEHDLQGRLRTIHTNKQSNRCQSSANGWTFAQEVPNCHSRIEFWTVFTYLYIGLYTMTVLRIINWNAIKPRTPITKAMMKMRSLRRLLDAS